MSTALKDHWEAIYRDKGEQETSWFRPHLDESLRLIDTLALTANAPAIDVGGGRATLVDDLLARGLSDVSVLDLSELALAQSHRRLGAAAQRVHWIVGDAAEAELPAAHYALWHDRAVFHFLTDADVQVRYVRQAARAIRAGGHLVLGCFAPDGPARCSSLPVAHHDADAIRAIFACAFDTVTSSRELHHTPSGKPQAFNYVVLRRRGDAGRH